MANGKEKDVTTQLQESVTRKKKKSRKVVKARQPLMTTPKGSSVEVALPESIREAFQNEVEFIGNNLYKTVDPETGKDEQSFFPALPFHLNVKASDGSIRVYKVDLGRVSIRELQ